MNAEAWSQLLDRWVQQPAGPILEEVRSALLRHTGSALDPARAWRSENGGWSLASVLTHQLGHGFNPQVRRPRKSDVAANPAARLSWIPLLESMEWELDQPDGAGRIPVVRAFQNDWANAQVWEWNKPGDVSAIPALLERHPHWPWAVEAPRRAGQSAKTIFSKQPLATPSFIALVVESKALDALDALPVEQALAWVGPVLDQGLAPLYQDVLGGCRWDVWRARWRAHTLQNQLPSAALGSKPRF